MNSVRALLGVVSEYAFLRLSLRRRLASEELGRLLDALEAERRPKRPLPIPTVQAAISLTERGFSISRTTSNTCLFRALARFAILSRHGHRPVFVLGVRNDMQGAGHAWVEVGGVPFLEPATPRFVRTFSHAAG